jgi:hypothetical protein
MKTAFCSLVVIAPNAPTVQKIRISRTAMWILAFAFVVAFFATVVLLLIFPHLRVKENSRARLAAENQLMKVENKNLTIGVLRLDSKVSRLEGHSQEVIALMEEN